MCPMRVVIQRVTGASVIIKEEIKSEIGRGLLIFVGIEDSDNDSDIEWLSNKIVQLRIFDDNNGVMNLSVLEIGGKLLAISQFTLYAKTRKGNRPSYVRAAHPELAFPLYNKFISRLSQLMGNEIGTGAFGEMMQIEISNDGPVTIIIDSKLKE